MALYVIGFTEAFQGTFAGLGLPFRVVASLVDVGVFVCVFIGAAWTIKVQYGILAVLFPVPVFICCRRGPAVFQRNISCKCRASLPRRPIFLFRFRTIFPRGYRDYGWSQHVGRPERPCPFYPFGDFSCNSLYRAGLFFNGHLASGGAPAGNIGRPGFIVKDISLVPFLIVAGVFAATLSSALGSMMGAPRILQAFAKDDVFPVLRFPRGGKNTGTAKSDGRNVPDCPGGYSSRGFGRRFAPIITMFFMITYGTLNLACFYEGITKSELPAPVPVCALVAVPAGALGCSS